MTGLYVALGLLILVLIVWLRAIGEQMKRVADAFEFIVEVEIKAIAAAHAEKLKKEQS